MSGTVPFCGAEFRVADKVSSLAFMRFAKLAKSGLDTDDMEGMAAVYAMLEQCIHPEDWGRFEAHADTERADGEALLAVIQAAFEVFASRPTGRPSDSSDGPQTTTPSSPAVSSSPATEADETIREFEAMGRPDLALIVQKRQESLSA